MGGTDSQRVFCGRPRGELDGDPRPGVGGGGGGALTDPRPSCSMVKRRSEIGESSSGKRDLTTAGDAGEAGERSRRRRR